MRKGLLYGVGINDSDYLTRRKINGKYWTCPFYSRWASILQRGYSSKYKAKFPTYKDVTVCEEWLTFSKFKSWMEQQDWKGKVLDKDLLVRGNKVYGPDTCIFIDEKINLFLCEQSNAKRDYPNGVSLCKGKIRAKGKGPNGEYLFLGNFDTAEEAKEAWRLSKLNTAKILAATQTDERVIKALLERYEKEE